MLELSNTDFVTLDSSNIFSVVNSIVMIAEATPDNDNAPAIARRVNFATVPDTDIVPASAFNADLTTAPADVIVPASAFLACLLIAPENDSVPATARTNRRIADDSRTGAGNRMPSQAGTS